MNSNTEIPRGLKNKNKGKNSFGEKLEQCYFAGIANRFLKTKQTGLFNNQTEQCLIPQLYGVPHHNNTID